MEFTDEDLEELMERKNSRIGYTARMILRDRKLSKEEE